MANLRQSLIDACCKALSMVLFMNCVRDFGPVYMKEEAILNTCCDI